MGNVPPDGFHTTAKSPHYPNPARFLGVESQSTNAPPPQHCSAYFLGQLFSVIFGATQCDAGVIFWSTASFCSIDVIEDSMGQSLLSTGNFVALVRRFLFLNASAAQSGFAGDNGTSAAPPCPGIRTAKGLVFVCFMPPLWPHACCA